MIQLYTGDTAELIELKGSLFLLKHHQKNGTTYARFLQGREAADAALAYLIQNGTLPPFPDDDPDDDIPY